MGSWTLETPSGPSIKYATSIISSKKRGLDLWDGSSPPNNYRGLSDTQARVLNVLRRKKCCAFSRVSLHFFWSQVISSRDHFNSHNDFLAVLHSKTHKKNNKATTVHDSKLCALCSRRSLSKYAQSDLSQIEMHPTSIINDDSTKIWEWRIGTEFSWTLSLWEILI